MSVNQLAPRHDTASGTHTFLQAHDTQIVEVHTAPTQLPRVQVAPRHDTATGTQTFLQAHDTQIVQVHTTPTHVPRV